MSRYTGCTVGSKGKQGPKVLATNRTASHQYQLFERFEAGIALRGTEVKSARQGKLNLKDGYARVHNGEVFLLNVHISPYTQGNRENHEPMRQRKLLLHAREIRKLARETTATALTIVPLDRPRPRLGRPGQGSRCRRHAHGEQPLDPAGRDRRSGSRLGGSARTARGRIDTTGT